ncbi:MAG: sensor domain-containing diguanylate cyclase, partial [Actinomycetota bacterium]|nr:sensor domain-containing diguanylate cyclase [Actinomycetota bacterium]
MSAAEPDEADSAPSPTIEPAADYEALFRRAPCGYVVTDDDDIVLVANDTFLEWLGRARDGVVGRRFSSLLAVGDRILYSTHILPQVQLMGAAGEVSVDVVAADGTRHAALLTADRTPATDSDGARVRIIVFSAHERRLYERDLLEARRRAEASDAQRALVEADLQHRVRHDPVTGLSNRAGVLERVGDAVDVRDGRGIAVFYLDLGDVKLVKDTLGHDAGDEMLRTTADRLRSALRDDHLLSRFSGDDFLVVAEIAESDDVGAIAERLLSVLGAPMSLHGMEVVPSVSIGVTVAGRGHHDIEALVRDADRAMHHAKRRARDRWERFDPDQPDLAADRLELLEELRRASAEGEFRL